MDYAGRQIFLFYFSSLSTHEAALRNAWDEETLHDMRVATRRLRVACQLLRSTFYPVQLGLFRELLRTLGEVLGAVRDLDVFVSFVNEYGGSHGLSAGLETLRTKLESDRGTQRAMLDRYLDDERHRRFSVEFMDWLHGEDGQEETSRKAGQELVRDIAPILLSKERTAALDLGMRLVETSTPEALHSLRIACKRLRYTAEIFKSCYGKRLTGLIRQVTEFQDSLGRHQDAHVHIGYLNRFIARLDRRSSRQRRIQTDLEHVISSERLTQKACHQQFIQSWHVENHPFMSIDFELEPSLGD